MKRTYFLYFLILCVGSLSVYNFLNNLEGHAHQGALEGKGNNVGEFIRQHRQRRNAEDTEADDPWKIVFDLKIEKLTRFVRATANETFQEEFKKVLADLKKDIPTKCSCNDIPISCQTESRTQSDNKKKDGLKTDDRTDETYGNPSDKNKTSREVCLPGPRGPPGPIGPPGKRGLGLEAPKLVNSKLNIVVNETNDVTFECVFFGNPIPAIEWKSVSFNDSKVSHSIDKEKSQITSKLTVSNVKWSNKGPVKCKARSILGEADANGNLIVHVKPIISLRNGPLFVPRGINYQFPECKVRAFPKAKITWKRLLWSLPEGRHSMNDGFLNISRVTHDDEGYYICEAENFLGKAVKKIKLKTNRLEMHEKPLPNLQGVTESNITCSAFGNPDKMSGQITRVDGAEQTPVEIVINKTENLFSMKAVVKRSGTYGCSIRFGKEEIKSYTYVKKCDDLISSSYCSLMASKCQTDGYKDYLAISCKKTCNLCDIGCNMKNGDAKEDREVSMGLVYVSDLLKPYSWAITTCINRCKKKYRHTDGITLHSDWQLVGSEKYVSCWCVFGYRAGTENGSSSYKSCKFE